MKDTNYTIQTSKDNYVTYTTTGNKKMNNYEKIKNFSIEEMAEFLVIEKYCWNCPTYIYRDTKMCPLYCCKDTNIKEIKQWLESESEE